MINQLIEQRNKLMADAAAIVRNEAATEEQRTSATKMITDANALHTRIKQAEADQAALDSFETEQRSFKPSPRPAVTGAVDPAKEDRNRQVEALRSFMLQRPSAEYRDVLTTSASGSAVIPQLMFPELIASLRDVCPMLQVLDNRITNTSGAPYKVSLTNYTGTSLSVVPEGTAFPELDPTFANKVVNVDKLGGMIKLSAEELSDSQFDLASWITEQFGLVYGYSLEQIITNVGTTNIPTLLSAATSTETSAVVGKVGYLDIANLFGTLKQAYKRNGKFMMSSTAQAALLGITASTGQPIFDANVQGNTFTTIFGKEVVINDSMPVIATGNTPILFGDFKQGYLLRTDGAPQIKRLDERFADTDEVAFIIRARVGGLSKNAGVPPIVALTIQ